MCIVFICIKRRSRIRFIAIVFTNNVCAFVKLLYDIEQ